MARFLLKIQYVCSARLARAHPGTAMDTRRRTRDGSRNGTADGLLTTPRQAKWSGQQGRRELGNKKVAPADGQDV